MLGAASMITQLMVRFDGRQIRVYMFSKELPPLIAYGGQRAEKTFRILRKRLGSFADDGAEEIDVNLFRIPAVIVFTAVSAVAEPKEELLDSLISSTPKFVLDYLLWFIDAEKAYKDGSPLIPYPKLVKAARVVREMLETMGYPV